PAVPVAAGERSLRIPRAGVSLLGRRPGRLHRPPAVAGTGVEGRGDGPAGIPPPGAPPPRMAADELPECATTDSRQGARPMTDFFRRWPRRLAAGILVLGLTFSPAVTSTVRAQIPE